MSIEPTIYTIDEQINTIERLIREGVNVPVLLQVRTTLQATQAYCRAVCTCEGK